MSTQQQRPSPGRIVLYRFGRDPAEVRPALVVRAFRDVHVDGDQAGLVSDACNLTVFLDGDEHDDFVADEQLTGTAQRREVVHGDSVGQWSWPPRV